MSMVSPISGYVFKKSCMHEVNGSEKSTPFEKQKHTLHLVQIKTRNNSGCFSSENSISEMNRYTTVFLK